MPHHLLFGAKVFFVVRIRSDHDRNILDDSQAVAFQPGAFLRIVGHQPHVPDTDLAQNAGSDSVIALVDPETQFDIGFGGTRTLLPAIYRLSFY